ncbi:MAG: FHA domain-containing protein, partial [Methylococcales bacterium]
GYSIKQLNDNFHLIINGKKTKESALQNNDTIFIGKHDIIFNTTEPLNGINSLENQTIESPNKEASRDAILLNGNLQFLSGKNIGKVLPLKKALTRLELNNGGVIIIARRNEGYFVSALEDQGTTTLNDQLLSDHTLKLNNLDVLNFENTSLQFFIN